jgi:hypothetical protein
LIAYASWANNKGKVTLHVDWDKTGMAPDTVEINDIISVPVGRRGIILSKKK